MNMYTSCATANSQSEMEQYECGALYYIHVYMYLLLYYYMHGMNKKRVYLKNLAGSVSSTIEHN